MEPCRPPPRSTVLRTARLTLRPSGASDAGRAFEIVSDWQVARNIAALAFPPAPADQRAWFAGHEGEWAEGTAYRFAVLQDGEMIGLVDLDHVTSAQAELGYWFGRPWWGNGYATEAGQALVRWACDGLGLRRLISGRAADNETSGKVLIKLGFRVTGEAETFSRPRRERIRVVRYARECGAGPDAPLPPSHRMGA